MRTLRRCPQRTASHADSRTPALLCSAAAQITTVATPNARALAAHLSRSGARMFGAFWCSHCAEQKEAFGAGAGLPYTECFPEGYRQGIQARAARMRAGIAGVCVHARI
jgi:hypothetical protein